MSDSQVGSNLSTKISALESSGFSPDEINEVLKRLGSVASSRDNGPYRESMTSWMLNYALPSAVVIGTGALFLFLTGGDDEPPLLNEAPSDSNSTVPDTYNISGLLEDRRDSVDNDEGFMSNVRTRNSEALPDRPFRNPSAYVASYETDQDQKLDNLYSEASEQWLKELLLVTNTIAADVKVIKEEMLKLNSAAVIPASKSNEPAIEESAATDVIDVDLLSTAIGAPELTTEDYLAILRGALREIVNQKSNEVSITASSSPTDKVEKSDDTLKKGCAALTMYARKVLDNPSQPRYRKISTSNASFKTLVQPLVGHEKVLAAIGFRLSGAGGSTFEWTWHTEVGDADKKVEKRTGRPDEKSVKEVVTECVRLFEICTTQGSSALLVELDKCIGSPIGKATIKSSADEGERVVDECDVNTSSLLVEVEVEASSSSSDGVHIIAESSSSSNDQLPSDQSRVISGNLKSEDIVSPVEDSAVSAVEGSAQDPTLTVPSASPATVPSPLRFSDIMQIVSKPPVPTPAQEK